MTHWRDWKLIQDLSQGTLFDLEYNEDLQMLTFPEDIRICWGPVRVGERGEHSRVWRSYQLHDGEIWVAKSDKDFTAWEETRQLLFVPSGATKPSIAFDQQNNYVIAVALQVAGGQNEVWICEYPYSGTGIRKIADGENPLVVRLSRSDIGIFYNDSEGNPFYRLSKDNYEVAYPIDTQGNILAYRLYRESLGESTENQSHLLFTKDGETIRYAMTSPTMVAQEQLSTKALVKSIDWVDWSFNVSFLVKDAFTQQPLEGALVTFKGIERLTNSAGIADFGRLGVLDEEDFTVSMEGYNEVGWTLEITEDIMVEVMLRGPLKLSESLSPSAQVTGITWEEVLDPAVMMRVYSDKQIIYGPIYLLTYTNPTTTSKRESFVWESKGQISNQDVSVDIYTDGVKRPGIALRCTGSDGTENLYAGYYRHASGNLEIAKYVNGTYTQLAVRSMTIQQGKWYSLRMQAEGSSIRLKIWDVEEQEPDNWNLQTTDTSISNGYAGLWDFDGSGTSKWRKFSLNGEEANWETSDGGIPDGWSLQFGTSSRWSTEIGSIPVEIEYTPVPNASITFGDQSALSNSEGLARFEDIPYNTIQPFEITHPDYQGITKGEVFVPELKGEEDFWVNVKIQDLPIEPYKESLTTSAQVTGIEWEDMRYKVTFVIKDYETGDLVEGVEVDLAGRKAYTDSNGIAIFDLVTPTPTIPSYDVYLRHVDYEEDTYYNLVIGGHDTVKQVTIPLQIGLKSNPFSAKPETLSVSAGVTGILWIEV